MTDLEEKRNTDSTQLVKKSWLKTRMYLSEWCTVQHLVILALYCHSLRTCIWSSDRKSIFSFSINSPIIRTFQFEKKILIRFSNFILTYILTFTRCGVCHSKIEMRFSRALMISETSLLSLIIVASREVSETNFKLPSGLRRS